MSSLEPAEFSVDVEPVAYGVCVVVTGELDIFTAPKVEQTIATLDPGTSVVVDLHHVDFVDSSGINMLIRVARNLESAGATVVLAGARKHVARVFEMIELPRIVPLVDSRDEGIDRLASGSPPSAA